MTDVRAILESEALDMAQRDRRCKLAARVLGAIVATSTLVLLLRQPSWDTLLTNVGPMFALLGIAAGYSPKHRKALADAIADPDPRLDVHFARALASLEPTVFALGQEAFVRRFEGRQPDLPPSEWRTVALSLLRTRERHASTMLTLLREGGGLGAIEPLEAFARTTRSDRLRTLARQTLGEVRLRVARERIVEHGESAERAQREERERLRL